MPVGASPCTSAAMVSATAMQKTVATATRRPVGHFASMSRAYCSRRRYSGGCFPHRARDDGARDLVRPLVDLGDLRVAHVALAGILGDVPVPPQPLPRLDGHRH